MVGARTCFYACTALLLSEKVFIFFQFLFFSLKIFFFLQERGSQLSAPLVGQANRAHLIPFASMFVQNENNSKRSKKIVYLLI
jgi:hypothetical protein